MIHLRDLGGGDPSGYPEGPLYVAVGTVVPTSSSKGIWWFTGDFADHVAEC